MFVIDSVNVTKIWYFLSGVDARMRLGTVLPGDNVLGRPTHLCNNLASGYRTQF